MKVLARIAQRYGLALVLLIIALVFAIAVPEGQWLRVVGMALQGVAILAVLGAAESNRKVTIAFAAVFIGALIGAVIQAVATGSDGSGYVRLAVLVIMLSTLPIVGFGVVRQVRSEGTITVQTMMGVLCAYLLLMTCFAYAYAVIGEFGSRPFFNQGEQWNTISNYIYYSVTTVTTVGMGDLTPASNLGRSLTAAEALIGQIYMVTVVAVIVANLGRHRDSGSEKAEGTETTRHG